jgi:hypothetical protein
LKTKENKQDKESEGNWEESKKDRREKSEEDSEGGEMIAEGPKVVFF